MKIISRAASVAVVAAVGISLAGCSPDSGSSGPVQLEYWGWAPNIADVIDVWNEDNPDIQVKLVQAAGADDIVAKTLAAKRAGEGPDLVQAEYQKIPNLVTSDVALDITEDVASFKDEFTDATWALTSLGDAVYAVPQDTGPMVFMYRADLFEQYGLQVPTTWDEYAATAAQVRQVAPNAYLGGYPDDASTFVAYGQPLGVDWWSIDGEAWGVDVDSPESTRVADYWQGLVSGGLADTTHFFTPEWNTKMNDGSLLSFTAGVWAPGAVASVAPDTAGLWKIAPMPSWDGETAAGLMGGSSVMVTTMSEHPKEATKFLEWLNGSQEGSSALASIAGLFPASIAGQESLSSLPLPELVSGQSDFWTVAADIAADTAPVTWGPNTQVAFDTYTDGIKAATANGTSFADVLTKTQQAVVDDLKKSGYDIAE